jgi:GntR family histidine utilization transcriptional repressor
MSGDWRPGHRVPSEHELMEQYGCSRMTVSKALSALASSGLIVRKRRSGTFVASPQLQESVLEIHDVRAEVTASGRDYRYSLLTRRIRKATRTDIDRLAINPTTRILALVVLHYASELPFVLEERIIPLSSVPEAEAERFLSSPPGTWLLAHIPWTQAEHTIRAESADEDTAAKLGLGRGAACLVVERKTWRAGVPVTWVRLCYPGDRHQLVARFSPAGQAKRNEPVPPAERTQSFPLTGNQEAVAEASALERPLWDFAVAL